MPGRHAEYFLESRGAITVLARTTTVTSNLAPAWYWRRFERLGVGSEHRYILQALANRGRRRCWFGRYQLGSTACRTQTAQRFR